MKYRDFNIISAKTTHENGLPLWPIRVEFSNGDFFSNATTEYDAVRKIEKHLSRGGRKGKDNGKA